MGDLFHSKDESKIFGLNFFRGELNSFNHDFLREVITSNCDIVRLKLKANDPLLFDKINRTGFPHSIYSVLIRNEVKISQGEKFISNELLFEQASKNNFHELQRIVHTCIAHSLGTYFHDEDLSRIITLKKEFKTVSEYLKKFLSLENSRQAGWLVKKGNQSIGYVLGSFDDSKLEGILYGILPEFRGSRLYGKIIQRFLKQQCRERGAKWFMSNILFQNFASLRTLIAEGALPSDAYINIHLKPFLCYSRAKIIEQNIVATKTMQIKRLPIAILHQAMKGNESIAEYRSVTYQPIAAGEKFLCRVSFPIINKSSKLAIQQWRDEKNALRFYSYARII